MITLPDQTALEAQSPAQSCSSSLPCTDKMTETDRQTHPPYPTTTGSATACSPPHATPPTTNQSKTSPNFKTHSSHSHKLNAVRTKWCVLQRGCYNCCGPDHLSWEDVLVFISVLIRGLSVRGFIECLYYHLKLVRDSFILKRLH